MTQEEYFEWLKTNDWVNLKRIIQIGLDIAYDKLKDVDYPKIDARDVFNYLKNNI